MSNPQTPKSPAPEQSPAPAEAEGGGPPTWTVPSDSPHTAPPGTGADLPPAVPRQLPAPFGRYELRELLGEGGMGSVYLAHDTQLDRPVALKLPRFGREERPHARERFLREARAAAGLRHPNICPVYDAGEIGEALYLSMAYVAGEPLSRRLVREGRLPAWEAAALVRSVALAMDEAHRHGVVHRDLKPSNVLLDARGQPVVMDFGLARRTGAAEDLRLTQAGSVLGTPLYMSPEQAAGDSDTAGPLSDIYSLGVILYELLTGQVPFRAETRGRLLAQIQRDEPPPPRQFRPDLDPRLEAVCLRALAKAPEARFASMVEFAQALAPFTAADSGVSRSPSPPTVDYAPRRRRRGPLLAAGALLLVLLGGVLYLATDHTTLEPKTQATPQPQGKLPPDEKLEGRQKLARLLHDGHRLLRLALYDQALDVAGQALALDPQSPGALALRGTARAARGEVTEALKDCAAALKANPETALAYSTRGILRNRQGRPEEAIVDLTVAIRLEPKSALHYTNRSHAYLGLKELHQAEADATEAIERDRTRPKAWSNRAAARLYLGRHDKALEDLDKAIALNGKDPHFYWVRAHAHASKRDWLSARKDQETAAGLNREYKNKSVKPFKPPAKRPKKKLSKEEAARVAALLARAEGAFKDGLWNKNKKVRASTGEILDVDPDHVRALELRADARLGLGEIDEARRDATRAVQLDPNSDWGYGVLSSVYGQRREWARSIAYATICLRLKPDTALAWNNRGCAYYDLGYYHQAVADATEGLKYVKQPDLSFNRAAAYVGLGEHAKALADLSTAIDRAPLNPKWYVHRSALHARLGNLKQAQKDWAAAVQLNDGVEPPRFVLPAPLPPPHRDPMLKETQPE
jgi:serine/threonine protein kinase/Tfp pilus assembly protein PilF